MPDQLPPIPTLEEAEAEVLAQWEQEKQDALRYQAQLLLKPHEERHRQAAREARLERQHAAERAEAERIAAKAHRKVFGRQIAGQLDVWQEYSLLPFEGRYLIVAEENAQATKQAMNEAGIDQSGQEHRGVTGLQLTKFLGKQDVAAVNLTDEQIAEVGRRKSEATKRERELQTKREITEKRRQRERDLVGVELD